MYNQKMAIYQAPKHVVVPYVENTLYSTSKYSCVRPVHTLYVSYFIEHNGGDEPHDDAGLLYSIQKLKLAPL